MRRRLATGAALASACAAMFAGMPQQAAAAEVGAVADVTWGQSRDAIDREITLLQEAGVEWIRANANWSGLEPDAKGVLNTWLLDQYTYAVDRARAAGIKVLMPIADGVPYWASNDPNKYTDSAGVRHWDQMYPPQRMSDYGDIVRVLAAHFRGRGVEAYEIWNEPNHPGFWKPRPDATQYVEMLRAGAQAVRAEDPEARVLLGGLSRNDYVFLDQIYAAGGGPYFDAVAVHPYSWDEPPTALWYGREDSGDLRRGDPSRISWACFPGVQEVHATMEGRGDGAKEIWLTEFGWATSSQPDGVSEATQAQYLTEAFRYIERFSWMKAAFWYSARNDPYRGDANQIEAQYGLFTTDWQLKPSYFALREYALSAPSGAPPSAEQQPPAATTVVTPTKVKLRLRGKGRVPQVRGSVDRASGGRVVLRVERQTRRGWRPAMRARAVVRESGRFSRALRGTPAGKLRIAAHYGGTRQFAASRSRFVRFSFG